MDLSLSSHEESAGASSGAGTSTDIHHAIEKEHMFDKVVTPSDVGKLNRLVIPKQHAEKYFPLDASSNEKGLLLNFEDRNGKPWRFRYSYWNSSQSYVMTKGWSRFVKEKKLDAGDIVSFQRGVGELGKDRLYIDWRRRPDAPDPSSLAHIQLQNQLSFPQIFRWGRLYSMTPQSHLPLRSNYDHLQRLNHGIYPYHHHHHHLHHQHDQNQYQQQQQQQQIVGYGNIRPSEPHQIAGMPQMVFDSVPVVHGSKTAGKRLRLFGVNMECPQEDDQSAITMPHGSLGSALSSHLPSSSLAPPQFRLPTTGSPPFSTKYSDKGKSSLSFDLEL